MAASLGHVSRGALATETAFPRVSLVRMPGNGGTFAAMKARKYRCVVCSHIYDPAQGDPDSGIAPGTAFEDLPGDWYCPDCGAGKADFEPIDE